MTVQYSTTISSAFLNDEKSMRIDDVLSSPYAYEQEMVKIILPQGDTLTARSIMDVLKHENCVMKIEGYEKLTQRLFQFCKSTAKHLGHKGPVTCHLFKSPKGSASFPMHTDPDHVFLVMVEGTKAIETPERTWTLKAGDNLYLPAGTPHRAINVEDSIMLSVGLELFTVKKL